MRLRKPRSVRPPKAVSGFVGALARGLRPVALELWGITREMLRIPAGLYMWLAEFAGALVLAGWLRLWPVLLAIWALLGRLLRWAEREVTPARATVAVAAIAAVGLAGSQFADYRAVQIGTPAYSEVELVAPAPEVEGQTAGSAHLWLGIPLAALALAVIAGAASGRPALSRALVPIGAAMLVVSFAVDAPKGLDEGDLTVIYEGAKASLLTGFWAQVAAASLLVLLAPLLERALRRGDGVEAAGRPRPGRGRSRDRRVRPRLARAGNP